MSGLAKISHLSIKMINHELLSSLRSRYLTQFQSCDFIRYQYIHFESVFPFSSRFLLFSYIANLILGFFPAVMDRRVGVCAVPSEEL